MRAATPSHAAELVVPVTAELRGGMDGLILRLHRASRARIAWLAAAARFPERAVARLYCAASSAIKWVQAAEAQRKAGMELPPLSGLESYDDE